MNVTLSLVRLRHEKIGDVTPNTILVTDSITTKNLLQHARILQRPIAVLALDHADHLGRRLALVLESADLDRGNGTVGRVGRSVGELLLYELVLGDGVTLELLSLE